MRLLLFALTRGRSLTDPRWWVCTAATALVAGFSGAASSFLLVLVMFTGLFGPEFVEDFLPSASIFGVLPVILALPAAVLVLVVRAPLMNEEMWWRMNVRVRVLLVASASMPVGAVLLVLGASVALRLGAPQGLALIVVLLGIIALPLIWGSANARLWRFVRRSALDPRPFCPRCGYSLDGLPTPICPECGGDAGRPEPDVLGM